MLRKIALLIVFISTGLCAQEEIESDPFKLMKTRFDGRPLVNIQYSYLTGSDYKLEMQKPEKGLYEKGKIRNLERGNINIDVPVFYKNKFFISTFIGYNYSLTDYKYANPIVVPFPTLSHPMDSEMHSYKGGVNFAYTSRLWNKPLTLLATVVGDGSKKYFEKLNGVFTAVMTITEKENTSVALGVYVSTSQAAQIPIFPIFTYRHRISGTPYIIDIIFPKQTYITRLVGDKGRLSAGFSLDNETGYFYPNQSGFKDTYTYDRIDLKLECKYEHILYKKLIANASFSGLKCYQGVFREKNKKSDIVRFKQDAGFAFNLGVRYILN